MKKILLPLLLLTLLVTILAACQKGENEEDNAEESTKESVEQIEITVGVPTSPPAFPVLRMIESNALGENVKINLEIWSEPESLIAMVQDGNHDMFAFPLTIVSTLYNKGIDVRLMNVNTWGVTYFVTSDAEFKSWEDLKGKTIYVPQQTSPPDALTQYLLTEAGLQIGEDVQVIYATPSEITTMLGSGDAIYATLLEPQVTRALSLNPDLKVALSFEDEWQRVNDTETKIPNAGFGTTQTFIDENPELVEEFQKAYEEAVIWANENPKEMGALAEKYLGLGAGLVEKSLPNMGLTFKSAADSKTELEMFYNLLFEFEPKMIGGKLPDDGLLYDTK